jgi:hypothetical protein
MLLQELFEKAIAEGGESGGVRYNSEVGMLAGFFGVDPTKFNPKRPEQSLPAQYLQNPDRVYADIKKFLVPNWDAGMFSKWVGIGRVYQPLMADKINELNTTVQKYGWAGGTNLSASGAVDIDFIGSSITGVSVKAEGGITLANLTPKSLGLTPELGNDIFYQYAQPEYVAMKTRVFKDALAEARALNGKPLAPVKPKYSITYNPKTGTYKCVGSSKTIDATEKEILGSVAKNANWQRPFGDWFQSNWATKKSYATPLYSKLAKVFELTIENHLKQSASLSSVLRFAENPYFYATAKSLYYVPSAEQAGELQVKGIKYAEPDGTSQLFAAIIGRPDSDDNAELDIYIRYANGMFETNPTVRVQNLKNPQHMGWEKLN